MVKVIIFDFGRTLYDRDNDRFFPEVPEVLEKLAPKYKLVIVSMAVSDDPEERRKILKENNLEKYFDSMIFVKQDKDSAYEKVILDLRVNPEEIVIVDDRVKRGIAWGNRIGATTIWFRNGKFKDDLPDEKTGKPDYIINNLLKILLIL